MNELSQLIRALSIQSWRYSTFRGRWTDMPESLALCVVLGAASLLVSGIAIYIEYGALAAMAIPAVWLSAIWMLAADDGAMSLNKRPLSAIFLLTIPSMGLLAMVGSGYLFIEVIVGVYLSATILSLKARA